MKCVISSVSDFCEDNIVKDILSKLGIKYEDTKNKWEKEIELNSIEDIFLLCKIIDDYWMNWNKCKVYPGLICRYIKGEFILVIYDDWME